MTNVITSCKRTIKKASYRIPVLYKFVYGRDVYRKFKTSGYENGLKRFVLDHYDNLYLQRDIRECVRTVKLLDRVDIVPTDNDTFFYSIDTFKAPIARRRIFDNYTVNYRILVESSFKDIREKLSHHKNQFSEAELALIECIERYVKRCEADEYVKMKYSRQLDAIESLFRRPAENLFEALQRILFYNQFLWQTKHTLNGLGRLDQILIDLYESDLNKGILTRDDAKALLKEFFITLHDNFWYKSAALVGDTGQIIILGGLSENGDYVCNELTGLFIEVAKELRLPDPKVLLRCSAKMPEDLLRLALDCIATGIGAPLLSNDDAVIPALLSYGYNREEACDYVTSACWEPLIIDSCDQNNMKSINFALPLVQMLESHNIESLDTMEKLVEAYISYLQKYIDEMVKKLSRQRFDKDPLLSLLSKSAIKKQCDMTAGGARCNNMGLTSVGMGTTVNSLLNIEKLVYVQKKYTLEHLEEIRRKNYAGSPELIRELKALFPCYGCDDQEVIQLTKRIVNAVSSKLAEHKTKFGGAYKFGLSAPGYISDAKQTQATLDGRKDGEAFGVHISSGMALPTTDLFSFAMQLDYKQNRMNGNVVDFIVNPSLLRQSKQKYVLLLKAGFLGGLFQCQMNVVDSKTLIAARKNPREFPDLVVRVWGFSAYFNDLPEEYKDVLIMRTIESEEAAA